MSNKNVIQLPIWKKAIKDAYPKFQYIDQERALTELGFAMQIIEGNEYLKNTTPESIVNAITNIARTGVTLNPALRLAYLVPRKKTCCLDFSYMGLVSLLMEHGAIKHISAFVVFTDEEFLFSPVSLKIIHTPKYPRTEKEQREREVLGAYSRVVLPDDSVVFEFMPFWELEKIRETSQFTSTGSIWDNWIYEMYKKTVIRRHFKLLIGLGGKVNKNLENVLNVDYNNQVSIEELKSKESLSNAFSKEKSSSDLKELLAIEDAKIEYINDSPANEQEKELLTNDINNAISEQTKVAEKKQVVEKPISQKVEPKQEVAKTVNQQQAKPIAEQNTTPNQPSKEEPKEELKKQVVDESNPAGLTQTDESKNLAMEFENAFGNKEIAKQNEPKQEESFGGDFSFDFEIPEV